MDRGAEPIAHPRFRIDHQIGEGGFGVVFAAFDEERREHVALKQLRRMSPAALERFKREFRELSRLTHRNLPLLYELFHRDDRWFFTMELIDGRPLRAYVTGSEDQALRAHTTTAGSMQTSDVLPSLVAAPGTTGPDPQYDDRRLRLVLDQLVEVIGFIHRRGYVHGDIKPSNVLVGPDDRVYLLDFGLVARHEEGRSGFAGTTAYAAPELRERGTIDRAHDAYALGSMLFELVVGRVPFPGVGFQAMLDKSQRDAPRVATLAPELAPDIAERIDGWLARLVSERAPVAADLRGPTRRFVGRERERAQLDAALDRAIRARRCEVMIVEGKSGFGKSALIESFIESASERASILASRASPKEHLPFNALDGVFDKIGALDVPNHASRSEVAAALKRAIKRHADGRPIVLWIDDVHWADADSAAVLEELVQPPRPRSCLLLLSRRPHEAGYTELPLPCPVTRLQLGPMLDDDARQLALSHGLAAHEVTPLVERAAGMALFLEALCTSDDKEYADAPALIADRVRRLPVETRALLDILSLSQSPLPPRGLAAIAPGNEGVLGRALESLCRDRLLRPLRVRDVDTFAPFHDQVRETVIGLLTPDDARRYHDAILSILDENDPRQLAARFEHLRGAGRRAEAASLAVRAADAAAAAGAYEQAALHVEQALALGTLSAERREALLERLVELFELAKLGPRAAAVAVELAKVSSDRQKRLHATIRAVRHYLACGEIERGRALLSETILAAGETWPTSEAETMVRLVGERVLGFYDAYTPGQQEARYELLTGVADGLALIDSSRSYLFVSRALARARALERRDLIALELLRSAIFSGSLGAQGRRAAHRAIAESYATLPERSPTLLAWEKLVRANMDLAERPRASTCVALLEASQAFAALPDPLWASNVGLIRGTCLRAIGDLRGLREQVDWLAREAEHRKDTALRTTTRFGGHLIWLADDAPEVSRHLLSTVPWPPRLDAFHFQHWLRAETEIECSLYEGDGEAGWARVADARRGLLFSSNKALQTVRVACNFTYARGLVGALEGQAGRGAPLRRRDRYLANAIARWLGVEGSESAGVRSALVLAGLASVEERRADAVDHLRQARRVAEQGDYPLYVALATFALAALGGIDRGAGRDAEAKLIELGVVAPSRFVNVEIPGIRRFVT